MTAEADTVVIRDAHPDEMNVVLDLTLAAYDEFGSTMPAINWRGLSRNIVRTLNDPGQAEVIVAEMGAELVGSVLLFPGDIDAYGSNSEGAGIPEFRLLAVKPSARGKGIGSMLMEECIRRARLSGAAVLGLHTGDSMVVALPMYERRGFVRKPEFDFDVPDGELVKAYRLDLTTE